MTGGWLVSRENGRNVSQIMASPRIREITSESGDLGINPAFGEWTGKSEGETGFGRKGS